MTIGCIGPGGVNTAANADLSTEPQVVGGEPQKIDLCDPIDLAFWALIFDVSAAAVRQAAELVGVQVSPVAAYLLSTASKSA